MLVIKSYPLLRFVVCNRFSGINTALFVHNNVDKPITFLLTLLYHDDRIARLSVNIPELISQSSTEKNRCGPVRPRKNSCDPVRPRKNSCGPVRPRKCDKVFVAIFKHTKTENAAGFLFLVDNGRSFWNIRSN